MATATEKTSDRITVRRVRAAKMLGISPRTLQTLTRANKVPHIKVGAISLYSPDALRIWAVEQSGKAVG